MTLADSETGQKLTENMELKMNMIDSQKTTKDYIEENCCTGEELEKYFAYIRNTAIHKAVAHDRYPMDIVGETLRNFVKSSRNRAKFYEEIYQMSENNLH